MNKKDLRLLLKPLVKECIKEVLFEEGFLSNIISEVVVGLRAPEVITESNEDQGHDHGAQLAIEQQREKLNEARQRMAEAIGRDAYQGMDLFEGTQPLPRGGNPDAGTEPTSPLGAYAPNDEGVNIDTLFGKVGRNWKKLI